MVSFLQGLGAFGSGAMQGFGQGQDLAYQRKMRRAQGEAGSVIMATLGGGLGQMPQPQMQPGQPSQPMQLPSAGGGQYADLIRQEATKRGIDPNIALAVYGSEGRGGYVGDQGSSFGPFQLHYGGVAPGGNRVPGLGDEFTKATGLDARDPRTAPQQIAFALDKAKEGGWGPWHGWKGDSRAGLPGGGGGAQPPAMPQQGGDWRSFAQRIIQSNPNISPEGFMLALQSVQPFMNMESRQEMALLRAQMQGYMEAGRQGRFEAGEKGKAERLDKTLASRERVATARNTLSEHLATIRDDRLREQFTKRMENKDRDYALAVDKFNSAKDVAGKRQALSELRAKQSAVAAELRNIVLGKSSGMSNEQLANAAQAAKDFVKALDDEVKEKEQELKTAENERTKGGATPQTSAGEPLTSEVRAQMQEAISKGKSREEVLAKAKELGYDISGF